MVQAHVGEEVCGKRHNAAARGRFAAAIFTINTLAVSSGCDNHLRFRLTSIVATSGCARNPQ
jgi:hypothetical protein